MKASNNNDEYKKIAAIYDFILSWPLRSIRYNILSFITSKHHKQIIDLCCGTGEQLLGLAHPDRHLTGIDLSPAMLIQARKKSPESITYLQGDATLATVEADFFDCAILSFALHEKSEKIHNRLFVKACDIVRPGGHIILCDFSQVTDSTLSQFFGHVLIPMVEKLAGSKHFENYQYWMRHGALESFCARHNKQPEQISSHYSGTIQLVSITV